MGKTTETVSPDGLAALVADKDILGLGKDRVKEHLENRLLGVRAALLDTTTTRFLTSAATDISEEQRDAQLGTYDKQIETLKASISALENAVASL